MKYQIISDGSCDLPSDLVKEKNLVVVPFYVSFDDKTYQKENVDIGIRDFYEQMVANPGVYPKSSMPSTHDYIDVFTAEVEKGNAVICLCITTKFSGSMQSAVAARDIVLETHPEAEITVIDTMINTVLQGIYVLEALKLRDAGVPYEEAVARLLAVRESGRILFTVGDANYLRHGGRIGKVASAAVNVFGIRPLITMKEGEIFSSGIVKGRKKSLTRVISMAKDYLHERNADIDDYSVCVGFGYDIPEGRQFRDDVEAALTAEFGKPVSVPMFQIGATIAVHTGPYPLGISIVKKP